MFIIGNIRIRLCLFIFNVIYKIYYTKHNESIYSYISLTNEPFLLFQISDRQYGSHNRREQEQRGVRVRPSEHNLSGLPAGHVRWRSGEVHYLQRKYASIQKNYYFESRRRHYIYGSEFIARQTLYIYSSSSTERWSNWIYVSFGRFRPRAARRGILYICKTPERDVK